MTHDDAVCSVTFSPDGTKVATASGASDSWWGLKGGARLWDAATGRPLGEPMRHDGRVHSVAFSPDGTKLATASEDKTARLWNATTGRPLRKPIRDDRWVEAVALSADGTKIATAGLHANVRLWDAMTGQPLGKAAEHYWKADAMVFSPDGTKLATASQAAACLWDATTGRPLGEPMRLDGEGWVWFVAFSPDGTKLATASHDNTARLWDATTGRPLGEPMRHYGSVQAVAFSPDGSRIATGSLDGTARLWDATTGRPLGGPMRHDGHVDAAVFSADGAKVATASKDKTARLWDATTGRPLGEPMRHDDWVYAVAFSADSTKVATASGRRLLTERGPWIWQARVWDATTGRRLGAPISHDGYVWTVAFSPDGTRVATASSDKTARLWDAMTGRPLGGPMEHYGRVQAVVFSPDGAKVATATPDGTARFWLVPPSLPDDPHCVSAYVDIIAGRRADPDSATHRLTVAQIEEVRHEVLKRPTWLDKKRQDAARQAHAWHEIEARDDEAAERWFAAAFHLGWLCKEDPKDVDLQNRLRHAKEEWAKTREKGGKQASASGVPPPATSSPADSHAPSKNQNPRSLTEPHGMGTAPPSPPGTSASAGKRS
jgi:WD40 repeat protein